VIERGDVVRDLSAPAAAEVKGNMESQATTDVSDYIAALKRRRRMLAYIVVPLALLGIGLAIGLPDRFTSQALFTFAKAEVSGELPTIGRQEKEYADQ